MSFKPRGASPLQKVREMILALPETFEKVSHGSPTWWGGKRTFATYHDGHYDDGNPSIWIKAAPGVQDELVAMDPKRFFRPKYLGPAGWVALRLGPATNWGEVEALLLAGYRLVAKPPRI